MKTKTKLAKDDEKDNNTQLGFHLNITFTADQKSSNLQQEKWK